MKLSDIIEQYIKEVIKDDDFVELKRNDLALRFNCVPSQINYVISTRFVPELGFYVESRRGGGGYIRINKIDLSKSEQIANILDKIGGKLSQSVADIYLNEFLRYNVLDQKEANLIKIAISDKSLDKVENGLKDLVRADIFKCMIVNLV